MAQPRANARRWFAGLTALFDAIMAEEKLGHSHFYTYALDRILAAAIVASCASLALSVRARLNRRVENEPAMPRQVEVGWPESVSRKRRRPDGYRAHRRAAQ